MSDILLHIDKDTNASERNDIKDMLLHMDGVIDASYRDKTSHLFIVTYDAERVKSQEFIFALQQKNMRAELVGL